MKIQSTSYFVWTNPTLKDAITTTAAAADVAEHSCAIKSHYKCVCKDCFSYYICEPTSSAAVITFASPLNSSSGMCQQSAIEHIIAFIHHFAATQQQMCVRWHFRFLFKVRNRKIRFMQLLLAQLKPTWKIFCAPFRFFLFSLYYYIL